LVLICAVLICTPNYITLYFSGDFVPNHWLFATYSVLNFYVLALLAAPLWLRLIANSPVLRSVWLGAAHWVVGILLSHIWSANGDLGMADFIRQNLFAGPFAYLQLEGTALLSLPIGLGLKRAGRTGRYVEFSLRLFPFAIALTVGGAALGYYAGELDLRALVSGALKSPPRVWYWMFFSGPALAMLLGLVALEVRSKPARNPFTPLGLFGQGALPIYTAHAFILPALAGVDTLVAIEGITRIVIPFVLFGSFCVLVMEYYRLKNARRFRRGRIFIASRRSAAGS